MIADADGYSGPAELTAGAERFDVQVELRGHFQPIDGRYHWYGRVARNDDLSAALPAGSAGAVIDTGHGAVPCRLSEPDLWHRYRITGVSTPPYRIGKDPAGAE
ncbi:MAG TPA: DUF4873 domain-containing protein [Streptosporangiaceae bacterium]|nr:DUF4873 domain-containing protein [Streptosporangiaceae bacterium]